MFEDPSMFYLFQDTFTLLCSLMNTLNSIGCISLKVALKLLILFSSLSKDCHPTLHHSQNLSNKQCPKIYPNFSTKFLC